MLEDICFGLLMFISGLLIGSYLTDRKKSKDKSKKHCAFLNGGYQPFSKSKKSTGKSLPKSR